GINVLAGGQPPEYEFDGIVLSPGIPRKSEDGVAALKQTELLIGEIELASLFWNYRIVAITGTNGKTTTTQLVERALNHSGIRAISCGNIGKPFSQVVEEEEEEAVAVVEVSSFQLESIKDFHPQVSVYMNLAPDHLDRYADMNAYSKAKERIFENQQAQDLAVVQSDLGLENLETDVVTFSSSVAEAHYTFRNGWIHFNGEPSIELKKTRLRGAHNAENVMATLAVAKRFEANLESTIEAIDSYEPLPHRYQWVATVDEVEYFNDSKATNPHALLKALQGYRNNVVLIAGGKNKGFDFSEFTSQISISCRAVIAIGASANEIISAWEEVVECKTAETLEKAVELSFLYRDEVEAVLFSPACASFDMFKNFEERGERFMEAVLKLKETYKGE
ncbi:MAG: UDP-N-acetylmuramoyl-L-alanine--D-glutamate ligase, partial [Verrucomicrobiota bacterium]